MKKKYIAEEEQRLAKKQLNSWNIWVECRSIQRKLKANNVPFEWMEEYLKDNWYTISEETFNLIKEKVRVLINKNK